MSTTLNQPPQTQPRITPEEFLVHPDRDLFELVNGQLVEQKMSMESVWIAGELFRRLAGHVMEHKLGRAYPDGLTYQCFNDLEHDPFLLRRPDCTFIRKGRVTPGQFAAGHCRVVPDLIVEVVSPNDTYYDVQQRVHEFRAVGCPLVWVIDPESRTAMVYRKDGCVSEVNEQSSLEGEDVIEGFSVCLAEVLPPQNLEGNL